MELEYQVLYSTEFRCKVSPCECFVPPEWQNSTNNDYYCDLFKLKNEIEPDGGPPL